MKLDKKQREDLFKELEGKQYKIKKVVKVAINQGQYFVRIPKKISNELDLSIESKVEFILTVGKRSKILELVKV